MIIRHDVTSDTYAPLPITDEALRLLKKTFRDHAPGVGLDLYYTDIGEPYVSVTDPRLTLEEDTWIIIRGEQGWQMHRGGDGPLYEFATEREVAEFFCSRAWVSREWPIRVRMGHCKGGAFRRSWAPSRPLQ